MICRHAVYKHKFKYIQTYICHSYVRILTIITRTYILLHTGTCTSTMIIIYDVAEWAMGGRIHAGMFENLKATSFQQQRRLDLSALKREL